MARFEHYEPGQFSWVDLMSPDPEASAAFYGALFGWRGETTADDAGGRYTMFRRQGVDVAGMGVLTDEMPAMGAPPSWNSYVSVEDVDAKLAHAQSLGATAQGPVIDIDRDGERVGRMAVLFDPEGAAFSLWQPGRHVGAGVTNEPGTFGWNELLSRDVEAAKRFYGELLGWGFADMGDGYHEIRVGDRPNGGILPHRPEMGDVPCYWAVYFNTADCDATVKQLQELGGTLLMGPVDIEPGRFAVVMDPQGAAFHVMWARSTD